MLATVASALAGVLLDRLFGEPRRFHPLVGFGRCADVLEAALRRGTPGHPLGNRLRGALGWLMLVAPPVALAVWASHPVLDALLLYFALGGRSLAEHGRRVARDLAAGDLAAARTHVGWMVSRDTFALDEEGLARAATESVLENGHDAVFGVLFWFCLLGGAGALAFRLANTLDAMWGYKDDRRLYFGWAAARLDDLMGFVPARLTALTYALLGDARTALACWRAQAGAWASPNAGPVMAAGAGALRVQLGGAAVYHGRLEQRPQLGAGPSQAEVRPPRGGSEPGLRAWGVKQLGAGVPCTPGIPLRGPATANRGHIEAAVRLIERGQWLWLAAITLASLVRWSAGHG